MYFAANFLRLRKRKKEAGLSEKNMNIDYCAFTFFVEKNSARRNASFQTTDDK